MATIELHSNSRYFLSIDGLRLIASVNIVLFHIEYVGGFTDLGGSPGWFFTLVKGPYFHATIFFLLGGFIFSSKYASSAATFKTRPFFIKRLRELYPLHCITTLSMLILEIVRTNISGTLNIPKLIYSTFLHLTFLWPIFPFNCYSLNSPSWALDTFFLCYLLFGFLLRFVSKLSTIKHVIITLVGCIVILSIWNSLYGLLGTPFEFFQFFHIFSPIRVFEFLAGMLLARFFMFSYRVKMNGFSRHILTDIILFSIAFFLFEALGKQLIAAPGVIFFSYHVFMPMFFMCILYLIAAQKGIIAHILALPVIRNIGRSSFYPYLLHIPIMSWVTFFAEYYYKNDTLLHNPRNVWIFVITLYLGSYVYVYFIKKKFKQKKVSFAMVPATNAITALPAEVESRS